jgi:Na+-driven multidrug efflux pump
MTAPKRRWWPELDGWAKVIEMLLVSAIECLVIVTLLGLVLAVAMPGHPEAMRFGLFFAWIFAILVTWMRFRAWHRYHKARMSENPISE